MSDLTCTAHKVLHATILRLHIDGQQVADGEAQARLTLLSVAGLLIIAHHQMLCEDVFSACCNSAEQLAGPGAWYQVGNSVHHKVCDYQQEIQNTMAV